MIAGVDGCKESWIAVVDVGGDQTEIRPPAAFHEILEDRRLQLVVVDIPIGLADAGPRDADVCARQFLGKRGCCVFPAPIRPIIDCATWDQACTVRFAIEGKKISRQQYGILDKVRKVDTVLRESHLGSVVEGHPEVSFALMNEGYPLLSSKKKRTGRECRSELVFRNFPDAGARIAKYGRHHEDVLDAYALLWTARRVKFGGARRFPEEARFDRFGLRMEIVG